MLLPEIKIIIVHSLITVIDIMLYIMHALVSLHIDSIFI